MFGTFHIYHYDEYLKAKHITKLALDPLNAKFDAKYLNSKLSHINRAIKTAILDQTNVAGIGNIYADEILFLTKIHPLTIAKHLNLKQYELIVKYAKQVLKQAIKYGGTTIATYKSDARHIGQYQNKLLVHMRANQPCKVCHTLIEKIKVNGRGTYFCPKCQKKY
jgi:formamidopyrimidine-DNA glycosylase